jgi:hypothetical protein
MAPVRWWDGAEWTGHVSGPPPPQPGWVSPLEFAKAVHSEERMWRWARLALYSLIFTAAGQAIAAFSAAHTFHRIFNCIQVANQDTSQCGQQFSGTFYFTGYADLFFLVTLAAAIPFLMWQHSATTVARGLGYPARTSPGMGVGSWFIPIISLWYPYWALSDTLPPDHPLRGRCLWAWLCYLGSGLFYGGAFFAALASTPAAVVLLILGGAMTLSVVLLGTVLVVAVRDDHQARLAPAATS